MFPHDLTVPAREVKPRTHGLTMMIDPGLPTGQFADVLASYGEQIDYVKFGWCTGLVSPHIDAKIAAARSAGVEFYFGGTLFERYLAENRVDEWAKLCHDAGATTVEISNGVLPLTNSEKARHIERFAAEFTVISEVGYKDPTRSETLSPVRWIEYIRQDLAAGAALVIAEARESGRSGICRPNGELRYGLIEEISDAGLDLNRVMFEAPTKDLQVYLLRRLGPNTNLGNIHAEDVIGLETLRLGLRADTMSDFAPAHS
jgi:phosphosulfolactate synthase